MLLLPLNRGPANKAAALALLPLHRQPVLLNLALIWTSAISKTARSNSRRSADCLPDSPRMPIQPCPASFCFYSSLWDWCPTVVPFSSRLCPKIETIVEWIWCWDRKRTNLGLVSHYCPIFVHLMSKDRDNCRTNRVCGQKEDKFRTDVSLLSHVCPAYVQK